LVRELRASWKDPAMASEQSRLEAVAALDLLIVDEVSRHAMIHDPVEHLHEVVSAREEWLRPTILTTNETEAGLREWLSPPLMARIDENGKLWEFGDAPYGRITLVKGEQAGEGGG
jgi:DNA replication protein DnaC